MNSDPVVRQVEKDKSGLLIAVVTVVLALAVVSVVLATLVYSIVNEQAEQAKLTECVRTINNEVNDQRWDNVYAALAASVTDNDLAAREAIESGQALKGEIIRRINNECPV